MIEPLQNGLLLSRKNRHIRVAAFSDCGTLVQRSEVKAW